MISNQQTSYLFTVFTATYNRADTLHRVYESLMQQTFRDFEWLIVDDGSSDQTRILIEQWQQTASFPIRYYWQANQGKHVAFNRGVQEAKGELFLNLDSDDSCVASALERFAFHWNDISENDRARFSAVTALCMDVDGNIIGDRYPYNVIDCDRSEIVFKYKVKGDKWGFQRTDILRQFPYPVQDQEKFIGEGVIWSEIGRRYKTRFVNEALSIVYQSTAGRTDQLTHAPLSSVALGCAMLHQAILNNEIQWLRYAPLDFLRSAALYSRFSFHLRRNSITQLHGLHNAQAKILWAIGVLIGYPIYLRDTGQASQSRKRKGSL